MGRMLEGQPAVGLYICRERNANLVEVSRSVLAEIDRIRSDSALRDVRVTVIQNLGKDVTSSLLELAAAGAIGLVLSVIVLFFFLRPWPSTLMVPLALPSCLVTTLGFMYCAGVTPHIRPMMGLPLAVAN